MLGSSEGLGLKPWWRNLGLTDNEPRPNPRQNLRHNPRNTPAKTQSLAPKPPSESRPTPTKTSVKTPQLCYAPAGREKVCDCRVGRCRIGVSCSLRLSVGRSIRLDGRVSLIGGSRFTRARSHSLQQTIVSTASASVTDKAAQQPWLL